MIHQPRWHPLAVHIRELTQQRDLPTWTYDNAEHFVQLAIYSHSDNVNHLSCLEEGWDGNFFINDRTYNTSFMGGVVEYGWALSHTDDEIRFMQPALTKIEQVTEAIDFYVGEHAFQLKTIQTRPGGAVIVRWEYLKTTADFVVLIDAKRAVAYTLSPTDWKAVKPAGNSVYDKDGVNTGFWVDVEDIVRAGGEVRKLPEFVKQIY